MSSLIATLITVLSFGIVTPASPEVQPLTLGGPAPYQVVQGGTGWANVMSGRILYGNGTGKLSTTTAGTAGNVLALLSGIPTWTATTTFNSPLNYSSGAVTLDTSGSWSGNAGTASALAANGSNCASGFFPLGVTAAGVSENCTYAFATTTPWSVGLLAVSNSGAGYTIASSTLFGYTPLNPTRQITVAGTANQITSSAGAQDLSADRTWTLSLPSHVIFPSSFQATRSTTTHATSTNLDITGLLTFNGITGSTWASFCTTITGSAALCDGGDATGAGGAGALATSTNETAGNLAYFTSTNGTPATLGQVATGTISATTPLSVTAGRSAIGGAAAFSIADAVADGATKGAASFTAADFNSSSGNISIDYTNGTAASAGAKGFLTSGDWTTFNGKESVLTFNWPLVRSTNTISWNATTSPWASNQFVYTNASGLLVSAASSSLSLPNTALQNSTISGVALGSNLANLSATDSTLTFSGTYNGSTARTIGLNLGNANTWTALQQFNGMASSTILSSHWLKVGATASTTIDTAGNVALPAAGTLTIPALTSALLLTDGSGLLAEYTGSSGVCTNQVPTSISAVGALGTCSSINNSWWSGTDLSVANGGTGLSTFGGTNTILYTTAADTLSSEAALTYDQSTNRLTVDNASTTDLTIGGTVKVPYETIGFTYATSSAWTATTTIFLGPAMGDQTVTHVYCETTTGTLGVSLYDGTNRATYIPTASTTINLNALNSNNTFTKGESRRVDVGTPASSPVKIACTFKFTYTNDL